MSFVEGLKRQIREQNLSQNPRLLQEFEKIKAILELRAKAETASLLTLSEEEKQTLNLPDLDLALLEIKLAWLEYRLGRIDTDQRTQNIEKILNRLDEESLQKALAVDEKGQSILGQIRDEVMAY